LFRE